MHNDNTIGRLMSCFFCGATHPATPEFFCLDPRLPGGVGKVCLECGQRNDRVALSSLRKDFWVDKYEREAEENAEARMAELRKPGSWRVTTWKGRKSLAPGRYGVREVKRLVRLQQGLCRSTTRCLLREAVPTTSTICAWPVQRATGVRATGPPRNTVCGWNST